jgi:hypothetical protein
MVIVTLVGRYEWCAIHASLSRMGLRSGIKSRLGGMSAKGRAAFTVVALTGAGLLTPLVYGLVGDFFFGTINDQIVAVVGPHLPAVGKVIGAYLFSFVAACGLLWFAASWGYWLGLRDPVAAQQKSDPSSLGAAEQAKSGATTAQIEESRRRVKAREAAREIAIDLKTAQSRGNSGYGRDRQQNYRNARPANGFPLWRKSRVGAEAPVDALLFEAW